MKTKITSKQRALKLERRALRLNKEREKGKEIPLQLISKTYELAGDIRTNHNLYKAIKNYREALRYPIPNDDETLRRIHNKIRDITSSVYFPNPKYSAIITISSFILSLFFLSMNFTGAVIGSAKQDFSVLGILFFIAGLVFALVYARSKR